MLLYRCPFGQIEAGLDPPPRTGAYIPKQCLHDWDLGPRRPIPLDPQGRWTRLIRGRRPTYPIPTADLSEIAVRLDGGRRGFTEREKNV